MISLFKNLMSDQSGATAIEYGLIAALVSIAGIAALDALGTSLNTAFGTVSDSIDDALPTAPPSKTEVFEYLT